MYVKQLSVFVENKFGKLTEILETISEVNLSALSIADTTEFGILRMIVSSPDKAKEMLIKSGVVVKTTDVVAFEAPDVPGGLAAVLRMLTDSNITVEYIYAFSKKNGEGAIDVIKTDDMAKTLEVLEANSVTILSQEDVAHL